MPLEPPTLKQPNWHLEKSISVTHIFSTIAAIAVIVVLGSKFDTRLTVLEGSEQSIKEVNLKQDVELSNFRKDVREDLREISIKLDRLIERPAK